MSMTITEKILAIKSNRSSVSPGDNIWVTVDLLMTHDVCGPGTIGIFKENFGTDAKVWDKDKVVIIPDHYIFTKDEKCHRNIDILRDFAQEQGLKYFYDVGTENYKGVCHATLAEEGHTRPGEVMFGTDSHTCTAGAFGQFATGIGNTEGGFILGAGRLWVKVPETMRFTFNGELPPYIMAKDLILQIIGDIGVDGATYKAMEFDGDGIDALDIEERMTLCNMAIEGGGKNGIINPDDKTLNFVKSKTDKPFEILLSDGDANYLSSKIYLSKELEPVVAKPHSPDNKALARELGAVKVHQAYIGSCTGGKLADFKAAAQILKGNQVSTKTFIIPATQRVYDALKTEVLDGQSLWDIFVDAGVESIGEPNCGACLGGPVDTYGRLHGSENCISTTNRNFPGRMGSKQAAVYLASPLTVAASAIAGKITDPRNYM